MSPIYQRVSFRVSFLCSVIFLALFYWEKSGVSVFLAFLLGFYSLLEGINSLSSSLSIKVRRIVQWIRAMFIEVGAFVFALLCRLFVRRLRVEEGRGLPILFIHGYCNHAAVWFYHRRCFQKAKLGPIYSISLGDPFSSIEVYAQKVEAKIGQILEEKRCQSLILIGHSMGGLVALFCAQKTLFSGQIQAIITLGSPLAGTPLAYLAPGVNAKQMRPGSTFLKELQKDTDLTSCFHIATLCDQIVLPGISALGNGFKERSQLFEDLGHASLLFSPRVAETLIGWVQRINAQSLDPLQLRSASKDPEG